jgi:ADP-heptose:LPS heptosyltransferase
VVVDPMVLTPSMTTVLLLAASGAPWRIGIGGRSNDFIYTLPVSGRPRDAHHIDQEAVTATPFGVPLEGTDWRPELALTVDERAKAELIWRSRGRIDVPRLVANISATLAHRFWPDDRYVAVLQHVRRRWPGVLVLLLTAPHDEERAMRIAKESGATYTPTPKLRDAFGIVGTAHALFTPDTGIAHAASAFGKPAVVMLVKGSGIFAPYGNTGMNVFSPGPTLDTLDASTAIAALDEVLSRLASR